MKFEPQCKTPADLHREWARVLDMCENLRVSTENGWKLRGMITRGVKPALDDIPTAYEFSLGIVEGKHVFRGDTLYNSLGLPFIVSGICNAGTAFSHDEPVGGGYYAANINTATWNPPKQEPIIPEGFTKWHGGEWTGHPKDKVDVLIAGITGSDIADSWYWRHDGTPTDIIAYKIIEKFKPNTVMVELTVDDVEFWNKLGEFWESQTIPGSEKYVKASKRFYEACHKALERDKLL